MENTILFEIHGINRTADRICWMYNYLRTKYREKNILLIDQKSDNRIVESLKKNFRDVLVYYDKDRKDYIDILLVVVIGSLDKGMTNKFSGGLCITESDKYSSELIGDFHQIGSIYFRETYLLKEKPDDISLVNVGDHQWIVTPGETRYSHTYIWNQHIAEIFQRRFQTIPYKRRITEFKPSDNYRIKEYKNKTLHIRRRPEFDKTDFDMKLWSFTDNSSGKVYKSQIPHILLCYEWCNSWQHIVQDLLPVLVSIKEYLDKHSDYKIVIINNNLVDMIRNILHIQNEIICVNINKSFDDLTNVYLVSECDEEPQNTISNIRDNKYYRDINKMVIRYLHKIYPDISQSSEGNKDISQSSEGNKDISQSSEGDKDISQSSGGDKREKYILYLGRSREKRRLSNVGDILSLHPNIQIFDLGIQDIPLYERFKMFYEATMIIAPHGGSLYNIIACRPGTPLIEIYSGRNHINVANVANGIGLKYFPIITDNIKEHFQNEYILESENVKYIGEIIREFMN